jgi:hypothetical protein
MTEAQDEKPICPSCGMGIPLDRFFLHLEGLDGINPECPRQDLTEIVRRARGAEESDARRRERLIW